jgi:hypothetical protein
MAYESSSRSFFFAEADLVSLGEVPLSSATLVGEKDENRT